MNNAKDIAEKILMLDNDIAPLTKIDLAEQLAKKVLNSFDGAETLTTGLALNKKIINDFFDKIEKGDSVYNVKDIAENIVQSYHKHGPNFTLELEDAEKLARAYLDVAKELETTKAALSELEKENYRIRCEKQSDLNTISQLQFDIEATEKVYRMNRLYVDDAKAEITKLKKSREVLRKAVEYYGDFETWNRGWDGKSLPEDEAREAIKADDEIIGGVK